ncbi:hypothetical protein E3N88_34219 [Mikania micrantha]|uniref:Ionotropic glutamate receptor C-terminal domain-containing protein n=1 Tax=Mikania micrantha TaxID=192012 RepID=A0A5N6LXG8_9ASTR|nr:hypothetical protein E3N88_34219 [Mikania micrantha]
MADEFITASGELIEINGTYSNQKRELIQKQFNANLNICSGVLGNLWKNDADKTLHENMTTFKVCVPKKQAFHEFVDVDENDQLKGGFSIAIFCLALQELSFKIQPVFVPIPNENYTEIVQNAGKECDVVAGDFTITSNRTKYAEFTIPYMSSEIYMLVPVTRKWNQTILTFTKPFTIRLWIEIILACILIGIAIGFLEYREQNPSFYQAPFFQKLFMIIWYPVSKIFLQEGEIRNKCSKVVLVIWLMTIFIVMQIFTACLSSWLTLNQLQPKVPKHLNAVGYQNGSFVVDFVNDHVKNLTRAVPLSSMDDYKNAFENGVVDAIFDERPYVDIFLAKYGGKYMKVGPISDEPGLAFAFPLGSPLRQNFSAAVVKVTESQDMIDMKKIYLGIKPQLLSKQDDHSTDPQSLDVHSFFLLFIVMGLATVAAIIFSEISIKRNRIRYDESIEMGSISNKLPQKA